MNSDELKALEVEKEMKVDFLKCFRKMVRDSMGQMPDDDSQGDWFEILGWTEWQFYSLLNEDALNLVLENVPITIAEGNYIDSFLSGFQDEK